MQKTVTKNLLALVLFIAVCPEPVRVVLGQEVTMRELSNKSREWLHNELRGDWTQWHNNDQINGQLAHVLCFRLSSYDFRLMYATFVWNKAGAHATLYMKGEGNSVTDVPDKVEPFTRASFNVTDVKDDFGVIRHAAVFLVPRSEEPATPAELRIAAYVRGALCTDCARDQPFPVDLDAVAVCTRKRFAAQQPPLTAPAAVLLFGDPREGTHMQHQLRDGDIFLENCIVDRHERRAELTFAILPGAE